MIKQKLIIYKIKSLYYIFEELSLDFNFKIIFFDNKEHLTSEVENFNNYIIISDKMYFNFRNQFILNNLPISILKLVEKLNVEFLKIQFDNQSKLKINNYTINLNSRELIIKDIKLKLTEKEIDMIYFLFKSVKPVSTEQLQEKVWGYQSGTETHTVETHIYRLRKKIFDTFNDNQFINSKKNGYQIRKI